MTPNLSIVTPSFRQLEWLKLCAASVADQTGVEVEHIVQDAGTGPDLQEWAEAQPKLRLFVERDNGMYDALNRGLRRASGEICAYLNCDEQYLPGTLAKVVSFFDAHPDVDVLFGDFILIDLQGYPISYRRVILPSLQHLRLAPLGTGSCATFFRRRLLERGFYFDPAWKDVGDAVWVEKLLHEQVTAASLTKPLAVFTLTGENRSTLSLASSEGARRKAVSGFKMRWRQICMIIAYRIRKAFAGAYFSRHVKIEIYTLQSSIVRQKRVAKRVGFSWPKSSSED